MERIKIILPDGSVKEYPRGIKPEEIAMNIGPGLGRAALAARLEGRLVELNVPLEHGGHLQILTFDDPEARNLYRHTAAHVLAHAVKNLYPETKLGIGPAIEDGFYYDLDVPVSLSDEDLEGIEKEMNAIIEQDLPLEKVEISLTEAVDLFRRMGEDYKVELLEEMEPGSAASYYQQGEFVDLCAGPHLPSTGRLKAVRLTHVAGAYWRGDEKRPMLQRIYGTAFFDKKDLDEHLRRLEEAKARDHRRLGRELDLFSFHSEAGPGLVYWHPRGGVIREIIEDFWRKEHRRRGYDQVFSPHIAKRDLWEKSGHWDTFRESMYSPLDVDGVDYLLKPMNCPFHILMYQSHTRSYRDLPMRWAELGTVYRYERSGVLHGLLRVRGFTQDDAHIFCRPDQVEDELVGVMELAQHMVHSFGFEDYDIMLAIRGSESREGYIGEDHVWERAEADLQGALERMGLPYIVDPGEAKFYGPAIDISLKDALGRGWQGPTIQLDFNLPERFDLTYAGEDGRLHRPVMIHRTVLGSMERFLGTLLEHYAGAFPTWLAPTQVTIIPVTDDHLSYAREVERAIRAEDLRVEVDTRNEKVGYKIRQAQMEKIPYMLVVGDREMGDRTVAVRTREEGDQGPRPLTEFLEDLKGEVKGKGQP